MNFLSDAYLDAVKKSLELYDESGFFMLIEKLEKIPGGLPPYPAALTAFSTLSTLMLRAFLKFLPVNHELLDSDTLRMLADYQHFRGFNDAMSFLKETARQYFLACQTRESKSHQSYVGEVNEYIRRHLDGDLSLTRLGEEFHLHPDYLAKIYKAAAGISVSRYVAGQRISAAKELLADSAIMINDVAKRTGLNTPSYFTHYFKRHVGVTPQEYRSMLTDAHNTDTLNIYHSITC
ncbi:MAG: AraC family transcriptional regulator [Oscillospiraceae bacterium]|jgi:YesN/AraC family two-component response regulator|nr:AraC family transcriptional regulator [Oscillospiraceae bacterium]